MHVFRLGAVLVAVLLAGAVALSQTEEKDDLGKLSLPAGLVPPGSATSPAAVVCFLEGPAVDDRGTVFFSDIAGNRILKLTPDGKMSVFRADSGRTNGNTFDAQGRLISCEGAGMGPGGRRRIVRTDMATGQITVLTERYQGKRYNSPNDICADGKGRIWFTDPRYGPDRSDMEMKAEGVYRIDPDGKVTRVLSQPQVQRPNGIVVTPDGGTLYLIDSNPEQGGNRKIWALEVTPQGALQKQRLVYDFKKGRGGDGMRVDVKGNLWVAAGISVRRSPGEDLSVPPGVYVITPQGKLLGRIPIPEDLITNVAFGGPQRKTLYVTAGKTLYQMRVSVAGAALPQR